LNNVANSEDTEIILTDSEGAGRTDGWVEWSYVINLKENTLSVHNHVDEPAIKVYSLDSLPTTKEFVSELEGHDEEE
jgi:hypothetical protein